MLCCSKVSQNQLKGSNVERFGRCACERDNNNYKGIEAMLKGCWVKKQCRLSIDDANCIIKFTNSMCYVRPYIKNNIICCSN